MPSKTDLRRQMRTRLREMGAGERADRSAAFCRALIQRPEYLAAKTVAIFDPLPSEPNVSCLWQVAHRRFVYPRIVEDQLQLLVAESMEELERTSPTLPFREPPFISQRLVPLSEIDLILVPGLAFSPDGHRLGRGGGYYDRLLATLPEETVKLGACFSFQLVPEIPMESHDEMVDAVVTD